MTDEKNKILEEIAGKSSLTKEDLEKKIIKKQEELDNIVSFEGAAFLVADELNISIVKKEENAVKIKDITKNIASFTVWGKIIQMFDVNEFEREQRKGKVQNIIISDETGSIGVSLWNEVVDANSDLKISDVVRIENASVRKNNFGNLEIRCFNKENICLDEGKTIEGVTASPPAATSINSIDGDYYLISLRKKPIVYYLCPKCRKKTTDGVCQTHGKVKGNLFLVLSGIIDNGIDRTDAVFFNTIVYDLLGTKDVEKIKQIETLPNYLNLSCIGNFYHITGTVKENSFTKEDEITVRKIEPVDIRKKTKEMEDKFSEFKSA